MEEKKYPHLLLSCQHLPELSMEEKLKHIDEIYQYWLDYPLAHKIMEKLKRLVKISNRDRMDNLLIIGNSNNGKTTLIKKFCHDYDIQGITADNEPIRPILTIQAPPTSRTKALYKEILHKLAAPYRQSATVDDLYYETITALEACHVRVLVIDEFQSLNVGTIRQKEEIMNTLRNITNTLPISIVGVGVCKAQELTRLDEQYSSRFPIETLPLWKCDKEYRKLLTQFEGILPFSLPSELNNRNNTQLIYQVTKGNLGHTSQFIAKCARYAVNNHTDNISNEIIAKCAAD